MPNEEIGKLNVVVNLDSTGFQNGISNLNRQMKLVQSEFQLATAKLGDFGNSTDGLKLKADSLSKQMELQKQKVAALEAAYQKSTETKGIDAKATQDLQIKLNKAQAELARMENELKKTTAELEKQSSVWNKVSQSAQKAGNGLKTVGEKMSSMGQSLSTYVTLPLIGVGTAATKMAMDAVESENLFEVSMGKMAGAARKWSEDVSKSLGLNAFEVRKNVATFNVMLDSMGLTEKQAYNMSTSLTKLAYDMASFYNLKPEEAFEKLRAGISGETEPLKELGINLLDTQVQAYAFTHGIAKQGEELTEQQKIMARYGLLMQATSKAQGDLARTIDSPTNKIRIMTQQAQQLGIQFGQILIPVLEKVIATLKPLLDRFQQLSPAQQEFIVKIAMLAAAVGPALLVLGKLVTAVSNVVSIFSKVTGAISAAGGALSVLSNPITIAIAAIAALAAAAYLIYKNWDAIKAKTTEIWNTVKNTIIGVWESIKSKTTEIWDGIKAFFEKWWPLLLTVFTGGLGLIPAYVIGHWNEIKAKTAEIWNAIKDFFVRYWDQLKWAFGPVVVLVTYVVQNWDKIKTTTTQVWESIKKTVSEKFTAVKEVVGNIAASIKDIFDNTVGKAWDWGVNLIQEFIDGIKSKIRDFIGILEDISNEIKDFLGFSSPTKKGPGSTADKWAPNFMKMFIEGLEDYRPQLAATVANMAGMLNMAGEFSFNRTALAGVIGGGPSITVLVSGNYLANGVDEERLAQRISRKIAEEYFNSIGGSN